MKILLAGLTLCLALALSGCMAVAARETAPEPTYWNNITPNSPGDYTTKFNAYRASNGREPLIFTDDLNWIAQIRLEELKINYSHESQYNKNLGENILKRDFYNNTPDLEVWKESPAHKRNMLDPRYHFSGYASSGRYAVQVFSE